MPFILLLIFALLFITGWVDSNPVVTFIAGLLFGIIFVIWIIRALARRAKSNPLAWATLSGLLTYEFTRKLIGRNDTSVTPPQACESPNINRKEIITILRRQGFNKQEAESGADFANNLTLSDKVQRALQYLGAKTHNI